MNDWINEWDMWLCVNRCGWIYEWINVWINESECMYHWMKELIDVWKCVNVCRIMWVCKIVWMCKKNVSEII